LKNFHYFAARTVKEAVSLLEAHGDAAKVLAGGTDLIVQLREGLRSADCVLDVKKVPELMELRLGADGLRLGAAVPCYRVYGDEAVRSQYPALADATHIIGGWQIQGRASVGGNLANASPAADSIPPLIAYQAICEIAGPNGRRRIPVEEFCTAPGKNALGRGELLVALQLPPQPPGSGAHYRRFIPRNEMDIAVVGVAANLTLASDGVIQAARVALAAVAPTPVLAREASEFLVGKPAEEDVFREAGDLAKLSASPISDMRGPADYRRHLVGVLTRRVLVTAAERANTP